MRTSRFKPEEVLAFLQEAQRGVPVREICIRNRINEATFYRWRSQYKGLDVSGIRRLRQLEQENSNLRRMLGTSNLQVRVLKDQLSHHPESPRET